MLLLTVTCNQALCYCNVKQYFEIITSASEAAVHCYCRLQSCKLNWMSFSTPIIAFIYFQKIIWKFKSRYIWELFTLSVDTCFKLHVHKSYCFRRSLFLFGHAHWLKNKNNCWSIKTCRSIEKLKTLSIFRSITGFSAN